MSYIYACNERPITDEMIEELKLNRRIHAIKLFREAYNSDLRDANNEIDYFLFYNRILRPVTAAMKCLVQDDFIYEAKQLYRIYYNSSMDEAHEAIARSIFAPLNIDEALESLNTLYNDIRGFVDQNVATRAKHTIEFITNYVKKS